MKKSKKEIIKCDNEFDERHKLGKYQCPECLSVFCKDCFDRYLGECISCTPPQLIPLKANKKTMK